MLTTTSLAANPPPRLLSDFCERQLGPLGGLRSSHLRWREEDRVAFESLMAACAIDGFLTRIEGRAGCRDEHQGQCDDGAFHSRLPSVERWDYCNPNRSEALQWQKCDYAPDLTSSTILSSVDFMRQIYCLTGGIS